MNQTILYRVIAIGLCTFYGLTASNQKTACDPVIANMASVPWRQESLAKTVASILPQVDHLNVMLNGYKKVPSFLINSKITVLRSQDYADYGAKAKFFWAETARGYYFTIDDDLIYPRDYVRYLISKIEEYNRNVVVGIHGSIFHEQVHNYYDDRRYFNYYMQLTQDTFVNMLGTGTLAFHTDTLAIDLDDLPYNNMVDLWFAITARSQNVPFLCLARKTSYIYATRAAEHPLSISKQAGNDCTLQTTIVNEHMPWDVLKPE